MYKGKFDQKNRQDGADVQELLSQREQNARKEAARAAAAKREAARKEASKAPAKAAADGKTAPSGKTAAAPKSAPAAGKAPASAAKAPAKQPAAGKAPAKTAPQAPASGKGKKQKRSPRLGGVIFYTLYFMFILVFFIGTYIGLLWLNNWLVDYQAAQPTVKAQQVFEQLFSDPQWGDLYDASGAQATIFEGREEFVAYMEELVGDSQLTYLETSAGLSGDKKYLVRLGDESVASFTLVDQNNVGDTTLENLGEIPDWELGAVEVFFDYSNSYRIVTTNGHTTLVNDVELSDDYTIQIATTKAEEYLPDGVTMPSSCTKEITGLFALPTVTVFDEDGNQMDVTYDEATCTFTERTESNTITAEQQDAALNAAKTYCLWMIKEVTDRATVAKYFDTSSDTYSSIVRTTELWMQSHNGYEFSDTSVTDFCLYTEDLFSVRVSLSLNVTRTDGTVKEYPYAQSMFFQKSDSGSWLCTIATNVDVSEPVGKVRLTFMMDDTQLYTTFYETDATEIITPTISPIPEGQVFTGWVRQTEDDSGKTVLELVFEPDESGRVTIPEGTTLEPMTLYALFEDADTASDTTAATTQAAETTAETTEGGA